MCENVSVRIWQRKGWILRGIVHFNLNILRQINIVSIWSDYCVSHSQLVWMWNTTWHREPALAEANWWCYTRKSLTLQNTSHLWPWKGCHYRTSLVFVFGTSRIMFPRSLLIMSIDLGHELQQCWQCFNWVNIHVWNHNSQPSSLQSWVILCMGGIQQVSVSCEHPQNSERQRWAPSTCTHIHTHTKCLFTSVSVLDFRGVRWLSV